MHTFKKKFSGHLQNVNKLRTNATPLQKTELIWLKQKHLFFVKIAEQNRQNGWVNAVRAMNGTPM